MDKYSAAVQNTTSHETRHFKNKMRDEFTPVAASADDGLTSSYQHSKSAEYSTRSGKRHVDFGDPNAFELQPPSDFIPCKHCGRTFLPEPHERHESKCADVRSKPKPPPQVGQKWCVCFLEI